MNPPFLTHDSFHSNTGPTSAQPHALPPQHKQKQLYCLTKIIVLKKKQYIDKKTTTWYYKYIYKTNYKYIKILILIFLINNWDYLLSSYRRWQNLFTLNIKHLVTNKFINGWIHYQTVIGPVCFFFGVFCFLEDLQFGFKLWSYPFSLSLVNTQPAP